MANFADVQYYIHADKVGGWGPKRPKICRRNTYRDGPFCSKEIFVCKKTKSEQFFLQPKDF